VVKEKKPSEVRKMDIKVTFRHWDNDDKLKDYAESEIEKLSKYIYRPVEAQVIFIKEKSRAITEINILADHGKFFAREQGGDFFKTFDEALEKVEVQIKKYHDKHRHSKGRKPVEEVGEASETGIPEIIKSNEFFISKPITVEEAVDCLEHVPGGFIVFRSAEKEKICVLYRRPDGNFGLIEPD
jgi:putative sigma-54 modulation protein